jgi:type IV pilus assembly protein PilB
MTSIEIDKSLHPLIAGLQPFKCIPLHKTNGILTVGASQALSVTEKEEMAFICGCRLSFESITTDVYRDLCHRYQSTTLSAGTQQPIYRLITDSRNKEKNHQDDLKDADVIESVYQLITTAVIDKASDIHLEPYESYYRVRYRIDGVLQEIKKAPLHRYAPVVSRIKVMADLDIAEKRRPQDGRIGLTNGQHTIDLRVSTLPTHFGEKTVMRILDKSTATYKLGELGLTKGELERLKKAIYLPFGIILVTGPTGSGKSTTLYAILQELNTPERNIVTIEDPIEYDLPGINQAHARSDIGFTFASALRTFLRQDPDIMMVGEIRDGETAEMAVRAALTGHLVMSTLHTNDAPSAITRLVDMGVEPFLIAASAKLVLAQRLVRLLCPHCKQQTQYKKQSAKQTTLDANGSLRTDHVYRAKGCPDCRFTGYKGRTALFEILSVDNAMAEKINQRATTDQLRTWLATRGYKTLDEQARTLIRQGRTSIEEALRVTGD